MKKISTLVVGIIMLTCFLFVSRSNAQTGPIADFALWDDPTNTLIDFDSAFYGPGPYITSTSELNGFNVRNVGDEPLVFTVTSSNLDFPEQSDTSITVLAGEGYDYYMHYEPSTIGPAHGLITITTNDPNHEVIEFNVKGYGIEPPVDVSTMQFNLDIGTTVTKQMVVRNTTPNRARFGIQAEFGDALELIILKDNLPLEYDDNFILDPGDSATIDLFFDASEFSNLEVFIPLRITYDPFHYDRGRDLYVYKIFIVNVPIAAIGFAGEVYAEVPISTIDSTSFEIYNGGNAELNYVIDTDSLLNGVDGARIFSTGFEELGSGIVQNQGGWSELVYVFPVNDYHDWKVETSNPFVGFNHLRCTSNDVNYGAELHAPRPEGNATIIDMMVNLDLGLGTQWEFLALDDQYSAKKLIIATDGSLRIVNEPSSPESEPLSSSLPTGYFNLRFNINNSTNEFSILIDGITIYTGLSNAAKFANFIIRKDEQLTGSILDIDNFKWMDGDQNVRLLSVEPEYGSVPPMSTQHIKVRFDARNIDAATYSEIFTIHSNDINNPTVYVPVTVVVKPNELPVLTGTFNATMQSGETKSFTFLATDADDSLVSVSDHNFDGSGSHGEPAGYISSEVTASGNKFLTYTVTTDETPYSGFVKGTIQAKDARGGITSKFFFVSILPFRENDIALTNFKTGNVISYATDSVIYDVARPDINQLTLEAKLPPEIMGEGIEFIIDGVSINKDYSQPYYVTPSALSKLTEGYHVMTVNSIIGRSPDELWVYASRQTIIHVVNSAAVVSYQVVNKDGVKLMDLVNGSVIDLSNVGSTSFNVIASVSTETVRSVKFSLNNVTARIDNNAPYVLGGSPVIGDTNWKPKEGYYTLTAIPYVKYFAWGAKGVPLTIRFRVVNGVAPTASPARISSSTDTEQIEREELNEEGMLDRENILAVYPVPVVDELHIELHESMKGNVVLKIMNAQGQSVYVKAGEASEFRKYSISTSQLGISKGVYFVVVNQANGKRVAKKFIKE